MATTAAPLKVTFLGALQASLTVILTLAYGVLAARRNLIGSESARDLSKLCVQMFLPMLILTTVGAEMGGGGGWGRYGVIVLWSLTYTTLSILYGKISERVLGCPTWTTPACSFNNTTSLPLLLVQSLATTGLLDTLAGGSGDVSGAVERAKAYFLINSMISNSFTFAAGPRLLKEDGEDGNRSRSGVRGSRGLRRRRGGQRNTIRGRRHAAPAPAPLHGAVDPDGKDVDATTPLLTGREEQDLEDLLQGVGGFAPSFPESLMHLQSQSRSRPQSPLIPAPISASGSGMPPQSSSLAEEEGMARARGSQSGGGARYSNEYDFGEEENEYNGGYSSSFPYSEDDGSESGLEATEGQNPAYRDLPFNDNSSHAILSDNDEHVIGIVGQPVSEDARVVIPTARTRRRVRGYRALRALGDEAEAAPAWSWRYMFNRRRLRRVKRRIVGLVNPAMVGTALAVFVAVVPPLNRAMFGEVKDGALLKGWFTSSLKNVGDLFTVLQMFVVGVKLNESMFGKKKEKAEDGDGDAAVDGPRDEENNEQGQGGGVSGRARVPIKALAVIYALRFAIWPAISISFIYALAKRHLVSNDPILWFAMMIMPVGPPAILLSSLSELEGNEGTKLEMAKMLFISYSVSPVICFAIVGAMKACESLVAS